MSITITLPTGEKVRSASNRRYVVIHVLKYNGVAHIARRSDNLDTVRRYSRRLPGSVIYDQTERRFVV